MLCVGEIALQSLWQQSGKSRWGWARMAIIACALLLVAVSTVQVAHAHPITKAPEHCQLCLQLHSALPVSATSTAVYVGVWIQACQRYTEDVPARFQTYSLSNRPPPSTLA